MSTDLKDMYKQVVKDAFPDTLKMAFGDAELVYRRRSWNIDGEEKGLRYGENPDQPAALYELVAGAPSFGGIAFRAGGTGLVSAVTEANMIQAGKHPGKTNLTDVDNGANILQHLTNRPAALILKHNNPSGAAWSRDGIADALNKAFWGDRIAAFGGSVVVNRPLDLTAAELINGAYFEVVAAPAFEPGVVDILRRRKNLRILELPGLGRLEQFAGIPFIDIKSLSDGGLVVQKSFVNRIRTIADFLPATAEKDGQTVSARTPSPEEADDLLFAWAVESGVTSNSVIFAKDGATVAIGTGEQDRVGCVEIAAHKAYVKYADVLAFKELGLSIYELKTKAADGVDAKAVEALRDIGARTDLAWGGLEGTVLVSDGFFPFRDGVDAALRRKITAIAQPGGSLRDFETIAAANEAAPAAAMVFTGQRSFRH